MSSPATRTTRAAVGRRWPCVAAAALLALGGCAWDGWSFFGKPDKTEPSDALVLRGDRLEADKAAPPPALAAAHDLYRQGDFWKASWQFRGLANDTKNTPAVAEEARYYEAECWRQMGFLPRAADLYAKMLNDFPSGVYREQACQRMFDIANLWLDDTRAEMQEVQEKKEGKRWFVVPRFVNFDKRKPLIDEQGRAVEKLEQVRYNDMMGPLADKALFLMGSVKFFDQDYKEADHYYSQLVEQHPNSEFAAKAVDMAIICKTFCNGGPDYDGTKVAQARMMVHKALEGYPELVQAKGEYLEGKLKDINLQQAAKDFNTAEFYKRTGHPESAYFTYEVVRRRYPGTEYANKATERMLQMRGELEKKQEKAGNAAEQPPAPAAPKNPPKGPADAAPRSLPEGIR